MLFKLVCLYAHGVLLSREELVEQPVHTGNLIIEHWVEGSVFNRPVRRARLLTIGQSVPVDVLSPLFEPTLTKMSSQQLVFGGLEIVSRGGVTAHVVQSWLIRAVDQKN